MFQPLDPLIHSPLRLAIISLLSNVKQADFNYIKEVTNATNGNISTQIQKLKEAGYITVKKTFKDNYPNTSCALTKNGQEAFTNYVLSIQSYIQNNKK